VRDPAQIKDTYPHHLYLKLRLLWGWVNSPEGGILFGGYRGPNRNTRYLHPHFGCNTSSQLLYTVLCVGDSFQKQDVCGLSLV